MIFNDKKVKEQIEKKTNKREFYSCSIERDRNAFNHCCLSYMSRACKRMERFRFSLSVDTQRKTFRAKEKFDEPSKRQRRLMYLVSIQLMFVKNFRRIIPEFSFHLQYLQYVRLIPTWDNSLIDMISNHFE